MSKATSHTAQHLIGVSLSHPERTKSSGSSASASEFDDSEVPNKLKLKIADTDLLTLCLQVFTDLLAQALPAYVLNRY